MITMYKKITLFTFICLLALAGAAQNKDTYTILLSGASFAEPNNKWFEMGCRALHAIPINRAVSAESIAHTANKMLDRKSTRLNSSHNVASRMPSSA